MILVIDNYDSFTYNLVQYLGEMTPDIEVHRNDRITVEEVDRRRPAAIVISPGPCTPNEAGISLATIHELGPRVPILGVCLGHQAIGQAYGGRVVRAARVMHGKTSQIIHDESPLYEGVENPFEATRYHSLVIEPASLPDVLRVTARTADDVIMGVRHRAHPVFGVQFHPESILTHPGKRILGNFLAVVEAFARRAGGGT